MANKTVDSKQAEAAAFAAERAILAQERLDLDERIAQVLDARNAAKEEHAAAVAAMPALRQEFLYANLGPEKASARLAVLAGEERIAAAEAARDDAQLTLLELGGERARHMLDVCAKRRAELEPQMAPLRARANAIAAEAQRHQNTLRNNKAAIGELTLRRQQRAIELAEQQKKEMQRAATEFELKQTRALFSGAPA